ncbi:MAG: polysaccharide biosynthesis C-terminal domain-containing protein [Gemella sp.]|nr:polysaccharide biosynthesis C-terminal domain-containing protein [Gemella sp.]
MQLILPTVIFIGITNLFGIQILVLLGKEKLVVYSVVVGAIVNALINWWLIPIYSYVGTAYANLAAELAVLLVQMYFIRDMLPDIVKGTNYISMAISLILASFASLLSVKFFEGDFSILVTSSILFFVVYYIVLRLFKNEFVLEIENMEVELNIYMRTPVN